MLDRNGSSWNWQKVWKNEIFKERGFQFQKIIWPDRLHFSMNDSWQRWEHDFLNAVVTAINQVNDRVINYHVMSEKCNVCQIWNKKKDSPENDV